MSDQNDNSTHEEQQYEKRAIVSKYTRPIDFVSESCIIASQPKRRKTSSGDEVASFYRSIVSASRTKPSPVKQDTIWCNSCSQKITTSDYKRHTQGTAHMVCSNTEPTIDTLTLNAENVGFRLLTLQGWKYEEGLGKDAQGRRHPISTVLKQDRLCIGHQEIGRKVVTHEHTEIEKKAIARQRMEVESRKDPGKEIARKAKAESERRVAILRYLKS